MNTCAYDAATQQALTATKKGRVKNKTKSGKGFNTIVHLLRAPTATTCGINSGNPIPTIVHQGAPHILN